MPSDAPHYRNIHPSAFRVARADGAYLHDVELVLGASGCIPADRGFLAALRRCADEAGSH